MPALDILRAWIHPGKSRSGPAKKLRKQSIFRSRKADPSVTSSNTDTGHGNHRDFPLGPRNQAYDKDNLGSITEHQRNPSIQHRPTYADPAPPHPPALYTPGHFPPPLAPAPVYPHETQYFEYNDYVTSPVATSIQYPSGQSAPNNSWHQSTYETPGPSPSDYQPNFIIEPSEPEDWSPTVPDVHRQSSASQDEFQSMHGTFGLGDRAPRQNIESMASEGRWTDRAEYEQSAVYEFYEEDPDTSRPVSSYYPPNPPSMADHHGPHGPYHPPPRAGSSSLNPHIDPLAHDSMAPMHPPGSGRSASSVLYRDAPTLSTPQPPHPPLLPPNHQREAPPSRSGPVNPNSNAMELRERMNSLSRPPPDIHETRHGSPEPTRKRSNSRTRKADPSPDKHKGREQRPPGHQQPELPRQAAKVPAKIFPEDIQPEILERDYGSDDDVYQYIVPAGVDVIFRDDNGNEITRVGQFPVNLPQSGGEKARSAPIVVLDEHGNELYRSFGHSNRRRGLKYDGHILHDERMRSPRSAGSSSSRASTTKTFLIDEQGNQIPIASSNGGRSSSSNPTRQSSKRTSHR